MQCMCLYCMQRPVFSDISHVLLQVSSCSALELQVRLSAFCMLAFFSGESENGDGGIRGPKRVKLGIMGEPILLHKYAIERR